MLQLLLEHYRGLGYRVHAAPDGLQLGIIAANVKPDLIIADIVMPAAGGVCAYARLRSLSVTASVPVIFLTGLPLDEAAKIVPKGENVMLLSKMDSIFQKLDEAVRSMVGPAE
ncbi:MAG: response regulator [Elusimicrobia bacterium]|nr:response regulator [Elusimicrobiota bacterium]